MVVTTQNLPLEVSCLHMTMLLVKTQVVKQLRLRLSMHRGGALGRARCGPRHTLLRLTPHLSIRPLPRDPAAGEGATSCARKSERERRRAQRKSERREDEAGEHPKYLAHWACLVVLCKWGSNPRPKFSFPQFSNP